MQITSFRDNILDFLLEDDEVTSPLFFSSSRFTIFMNAVFLWCARGGRGGIQVDVNRPLSDRFPTSWSVNRGHHFFLWNKVLPPLERSVLLADEEVRTYVCIMLMFFCFVLSLLPFFFLSLVGRCAWF